MPPIQIESPINLEFSSDYENILLARCVLRDLKIFERLEFQIYRKFNPLHYERQECMHSDPRLDTYSFTLVEVE